MADCLPLNRLDLKQSALLSWTGIADAYSSSDRMNASYEAFSQYGMTFVPLTADRGEAELTLCLEGFLASHLAQQQHYGHLQTLKSWGE